MVGFTQTGAGATTPGNPDYRFALHTREGVGDRSGVASEASKQIDIGLIKQGVEDAGNVITKGYQGFIQAELTNKLNEEAINPFLENRGYPLNTKAGEQDAIDARAATSEEVKQKEPGFYDKMTKLSAGFKQGRMTQAAFELNYRIALKEAVAKNPGFTEELMQHAQNVVHLSGVRTIADPKEELDKSAEKQAEFEIKDITTRAKNVTYDYDTFQMHDPVYRRKILPEIMEKERTKALYEDTLKQGAVLDVNDKYTGKMGEALIPDYRQGSMNTFVTGMNNLLSIAGENPDKQMQTQILSDLNGLAEAHKAQFSAEMGKRKISGTIQKQQYAQHSAAIDSYVKLANDRITGKLTADMYRNDATSLDNIHKLETLSIINPHNIKAIKDLGLGIPGLVDAIMKNPNMQYTLTGGVQDLMNGVSSSNAVKVLTGRALGTNSSDAATYLENGMDKTAAGEKGISSSVNQLMSGLNQALTVPNANLDINQRIEAQRNIVNVIGRTKYKDVQVLDEEGRRNAHTITTDFMKLAGRAFNQRLSTLRDDEGYNIKTEFLPNGEMVITSDNAPPKVVDTLNKKYASAWNSGVKSMANLYKKTWEDTSRNIVELHGAEWGITPGTNPIEGTVPKTTQKKSRTTLAPELRSFAVDEANKAGLDPALVLRVLHQESAGDIGAISSKGAKGLMQLMPSTAKDLGVNIDDPYDNIRGGITYLKQQMDKYKDPKLALAAYNAGPGAVDKYNGIPPFKETQDYVRSILGD